MRFRRFGRRGGGFGLGFFKSFLPEAIGILAYGGVLAYSGIKKDATSTAIVNNAVWGCAAPIIPVKRLGSVKKFAFGFGLIPLATWVAAKGGELANKATTTPTGS